MNLEDRALSRPVYLYSMLAAKQDRAFDEEFLTWKKEFLQIAPAELCFRALRYLKRTYQSQEMEQVRARFVSVMNDEWAYIGLGTYGSPLFTRKECDAMKARLLLCRNPELLLCTLRTREQWFAVHEFATLRSVFVGVAYSGYAARALAPTPLAGLTEEQVNTLQQYAEQSTPRE